MPGRGWASPADLPGLAGRSGRWFFRPGYPDTISPRRERHPQGPMREPTMTRDIHRRDFLKSVPPAAFALAQSAQPASALQKDPASAGPGRLGPDRPRALRLSGREVGGEPLAGAVPERPGLLRRPLGGRHPQGLPGGGGAACPRYDAGGMVRRNSNTVFGQWLSGMSRVYRATGRRGHAAEGHPTGHRVRQDGQGRRRLRHGALPLRQAGLRPGGSAALRRLPRRRPPDARRSRITQSGTSIGATCQGRPALWWGRPNEWYTLGENLFRAYQLFGRLPVPGVRRGLALSPVLEQVRRQHRPVGRSRTPRLQPRQHAQQRRHGVRGHRGSRLSRHHPQRLRFLPETAVLRHRRVRPHRAHDAFRRGAGAGSGVPTRTTSRPSADPGPGSSSPVT